MRCRLWIAGLSVRVAVSVTEEAIFLLILHSFGIGDRTWKNYTLGLGYRSHSSGS